MHRGEAAWGWRAFGEEASTSSPDPTAASSDSRGRSFGDGELFILWFLLVVWISLIGRCSESLSSRRSLAVLHLLPCARTIWPTANQLTPNLSFELQPGGTFLSRPRTGPAIGIISLDSYRMTSAGPPTTDLRVHRVGGERIIPPPPSGPETLSGGRVDDVPPPPLPEMSETWERGGIWVLVDVAGLHHQKPPAAVGPEELKELYKQTLNRDETHTPAATCHRFHISKGVTDTHTHTHTGQKHRTLS